MNEIICGDALAVLRAMSNESVQTCVTSPPYFALRNYGIDGQIGLETTTEEYITRLVDIFREVRRVLCKDGTLWVNIGDSYNNYKGNAKSDNMQNEWAGFRNQPARPSGFGLEDKTLKCKDLMGIPWRLAFALRADGWYLRQEIIWQKPNAMPESVTDRCTKSHEYIFLLSKSPKYYFDLEAIKEPCVNGDPTRPRGSKGTLTPNSGRRKNSENTEPIAPLSMRRRRSVWSVPARGITGAKHFATFPIELITPCILAGCPQGGVVLDPFIGSGTTGIAALMNGRNYVGIELNPEYCAFARERIAHFYSSTM